MSTLYDAVAYPGWPYRQTHPLRTSAIAALLDAPYADPATARVLEIGCGDAANLIPMALGAPAAEFVGFDLSSAAVERGRELAAALGLGNLRLEALDILEAGEGLGEFDYVIAHGVYSWTPDPVRQALLRLMGARLSARGIAFLSYNTLPGCLTRQALRDLILYHLGGLPQRVEDLGPVRAVLKTLVEAAHAADPFVAALKAQAEGMLERDPAVLFHDEMSPHWKPFYLHEVAQAALSCGLEVLADVDGAALRQDLFPTALKGALLDLGAGEPVRFQQYQDVLQGRLFHQTLLRRTREAPPVSRRFDTERVRRLYAAAPAVREAPAPGDPPGEARLRFSPQAAIRIGEPELQAALLQLGAAWPQALAIADLPGVDTPEALAQLFTAGHVELQTGPWPLLGRPGERPCASALARRQLAQGRSRLTALDMSTVELDDPAGRTFVALLDGRHDRAALASAFAGRTGLARKDVFEGLERHLLQLARMGLLQA